MKRWTVMLVPHDHQGNTQTLEMAMPHLWLAAGLVAVLIVATGTLAFSFTYLHQNQRSTRAHIRDIEQINRDLANRLHTESSNGQSVLADKERTDIENRIRAEYETSTKAITAKLAELYEREKQLREIHGLSPQINSAASYVGLGAEETDGVGGPPGHLGSEADLLTSSSYRPNHVIYGLANPSADMIIQEIELRIESLTELQEAMRAAQERFERTPSGWPVWSSRRRITSKYGYRRDPFHRQIRHHDGLDIAAPYGVPVYATGRGVVITSGYENYLGHVVRIDHGDGIVTVYAHLSQRLVYVGQEVNRGDSIAKLGSSGRSTGPHLHYEVRLNGQSVDPEKYVF